jgi:hypothetical protein
MGGAYIAHFAMYATLEDRTWQEATMCCATQINLYTYFVDTRPAEKYGPNQLPWRINQTSE